jgi:predicted RNA-binding protein with RPS1 domain
LLAKTQVLRIREDVLDMAVFDALLARLPVLRRQQVGMVLHEILADAGITQQEGAELFGKHIVLADGIPRFGRHFFFLCARLGNDAELAIGDVLDFIVIVKNDALMTGHAKVFIQHVARKNIRRHQLLDGVAVLDIGVHQDGLVHISALSNTFVKDPHTVVKAGQVVRVKVLEVDEKRKRIALTMRLTDSAPQAGSKPEQRGDRNDRRSMAQHQSQSRNAPEPAGSMAAAFAKLRG